MDARKVLLRIMLWSLGLGALAGAFAILFAANETAWRVVGTGVATAVGALLLMLTTMLMARPHQRLAGMVGSAAVIVEYLGSLLMIWELHSGRVEFEILGSMGSLFITALPAVIFLCMIHWPLMRFAAMAAVGFCGLIFLLMLAAIWLDYPISEKFFNSSGTAAAFGTIIVGCLAGLRTDRRHWRYVGIAAALVGWAMAEYAIIMEIREGSPWFVLITSIGAVIGHANLVMLCNLTPAQIWVRHVTMLGAAATALFIVIASFWDFRNTDRTLRLAGAAGFIAGCGTLALLVLAAMNQKMKRRPEIGKVADLTLICPGCGRKQTLPLGDSRCPHCRLQFHLAVEEPRCPKCDYLIYMLKSDRCPECGTIIGAAIPEASHEQSA